jgi:hypothetical protein
MTLSTSGRTQDEQCEILAYARSRILAAEVRLYTQTARAHDEFKTELEDIIAYLEAEIGANIRGTTPPYRVPLPDNITQRPRRVRRRTVLERQENMRPERVVIRPPSTQTTGL